MPASRLRRLRGLLRTTASSESMERLNDIPMRPASARPKPAPAMVMAPDKSRFQRHSAHLRTRIISAVGVDATVSDAASKQEPTAEVHESATENAEPPAVNPLDVEPSPDQPLEVIEQAMGEAEEDGSDQGH